MKGNRTVGMVLALVGFLVGLVLAYLIATIYQPTIDAKAAGGRPDEGITVQIVFALLGWLSLAGAALMGMSLYGFAIQAPWAWFWGTVAATLFMLSSFFPIIPPASVGLPSPTMPVFFIAGLLWFGMLIVGGVEKKLMALAFFCGIAYVLTFMDGVATISRYQTVPETFPHGMFAVTQMVNWWGAAAWAVFIFALLRGKNWALPLGIFASLMSMLGGYPLGLREVFTGQGFSMFLPAPLIGTALLVYLLLPATRKILTK